MIIKFVKWFTLTVFPAFLPTGIALILNLSMSGSKPHNYVTELLFFILMISVSTTCDIIDYENWKKDNVMTIFFAVLFIFIIVSAILYGCSIESVDNENLLAFSIIISLLTCIISFFVQYNLVILAETNKGTENKELLVKGEAVEK
jgi:hypothetical protein